MSLEKGGAATKKPLEILATDFKLGNAVTDKPYTHYWTPFTASMVSGEPFEFCGILCCVAKMSSPLHDCLGRLTEILSEPDDKYSVMVKMGTGQDVCFALTDVLVLKKSVQKKPYDNAKADRYICRHAGQITLLPRPLVVGDVWDKQEPEAETPAPVSPPRYILGDIHRVITTFADTTTIGIHYEPVALNCQGGLNKLKQALN